MLKQLSALIIVLTAGVASAEGTAFRGGAIDCFCTDTQGSRVELGEFICLEVGGRMFVAQCQMSQNNPMWREISSGCFSSELSGGQSRNPTIHTLGIYTKI